MSVRIGIKDVKAEAPKKSEAPKKQTSKKK